MNLSKGFECISCEEMQNVNGGGKGDPWLAGFGTAAIAWAPALAFIPAVGPAVAVGAALTGAAAIVVATNTDFDLIKY